MRRLPTRTALAAALAAAGLTLVMSGCGADDDQASAATPTTSVTPTTGVTGSAQPTSGGAAAGSVDVVLRDVGGAVVGVVRLTPAAGAVRVEGRFHGLTPGGYHGFHIHQKPICDPKAPGGAFSTAGAHYNPGGTHHGEHAGDLPPLLVDKDGTAEIITQSDRFTLDDLRKGGVALIVHAEPDNLAHIPDRYQASGAPSPGPDEKTNATGDAGDRIACGVLAKS
ncbi:superoxide dismutase family protein [Parafrankia sp. EUN1f]|uniref:superoxide dismutase family protein n=1 Tax=Parafrankia sp. EUN1f TaxID=102897 RepID=UPI0001C477F8|nr:superoxide dismutase family protein [Parafrankia sp. EUN1f]EFC79609.1 superoxide dismutase copper/zinc binding [Parafrankia sp. EUN1f]